MRKYVVAADRKAAKVCRAEEDVENVLHANAGRAK